MVTDEIRVTPCERKCVVPWKFLPSSFASFTVIIGVVLCRKNKAKNALSKDKPHMRARPASISLIPFVVPWHEWHCAKFWLSFILFSVRERRGCLDGDDVMKVDENCPGDTSLDFSFLTLFPVAGLVVVDKFIIYHLASLENLFFLLFFLLTFQFTCSMRRR